MSVSVSRKCKNNSVLPATPRGLLRDSYLDEDRVFNLKAKKNLRKLGWRLKDFNTEVKHEYS